MSRRLITLFASLLVVLNVATARAQQGITSATCSSTVKTGCVEFDTYGQGTLGVQISGTYSATLQFEQTIDAVTWVSISMTPVPTGTAVTSTTGTGQWVGSIAGSRRARVRASAYTSGTANVSTFTSLVRNGGGTQPLGTGLFSDGTAAVPSITFAAETDLGFTRIANNSMCFANSTVCQHVFQSQLLQLGSGGSFAFTSTADASGAAADTTITRAGAGILLFTTKLKAAGTGPSLSTCNDGALATGSNDTSGRVTSAATMTACTITFSSSFAGNSADCFISNLVAARGFVSAASSTAFTVSGLTAGDDFMYFCFGR